MAFLSSHSVKSWCFTIYMGKPVGSHFGQMVRTIQDRQISSWNRVYHFYNYKSVLIIEKRPRKPETGTNDSFEEMEHEFSSRLKHSYGKFTRWNNAKNRVPFTVSNRIYRIFCKFWTTHISDSSSGNWHGEEKNELTVHWQWELSPL